MATSRKVERIADTLASLYPETKTFLEYGKEYELLFAIILSAQATDKSVNAATKILFSEFTSLKDYTLERRDEIQKIVSKVGLAKSKSLYIVKTAKILLEEYGGKVPYDRESLKRLPGVGHKTSGVFLAELGIEDFFPVDTHVHRVAYRLGLIGKDTSPDEAEEILERKFIGYPLIVNHRRMILFGRNLCKAINPSCGECPLMDICQHKKNAIRS